MVNLFQGRTRREGAKILTEMEKVRRFHDAYDSKTAMLDVGVVEKRWADRLWLGFVLSGNDKEIQTGSTMQKVYGQRRQTSSTIMPTLKYKKTDLLLKGLDLNVFASYNFGSIQSIDTASRTYFWDGSFIEKADPTAGELNRTLYKFSDNSTLLTSNLSYVISKSHSFVINHTYSSFNRKGFDEANALSIENQEPKTLIKNIIGVGYKFDWGEKLSASIFAKQYFLGGSTFYTTNIYTDRKRIERSLQQNNSGIGMAASYYILPELQLKGSVEQTYRLPEGTELFGDGANQLGNPHLEPEKSQNWNIGAIYHYIFKDQHALDVEGGYLLRKAKDFIKPEVGDPRSTVANVPAVEGSGVEGSIRYRYKSLFQFSGNATYQQLLSMDKFNEKGEELLTYRNQITNTPYFFANANISFHFNELHFDDDRLTLGYMFSFVEEYYLKWAVYGKQDSKLNIPRQISHNISASYSLENGKYNVAVECQNLADALLYDNFKLQKPGRAFYAKVRYFISK